MKERRARNARHHSVNQGSIFRSTVSVTKLPELKEGQLRCECGRGVRLKADGTIRGHRTLISNVVCLHSGTEPKVP